MKPGTEAEYVQQILERLGAESASGEEPATGVERVMAAALELERAEPGGAGDALSRLRSWAMQEGGSLGSVVDGRVSREASRSKRTLVLMAEGLASDPDGVLRTLANRLEASQGPGRAILARLCVLALLDAAAPKGVKAGQGLLAAMRSVRGAAGSD